MKTTVKSIAGAINRFLDIPSTDPDDARRRKFLSILLIGFAIMLLILLLPVTAIFSKQEWETQKLPVLISYAGTFVFVLVLLAINRYGPSWLSSCLFLLLLLASFLLVEEPAELVDGRSLVLFALPIVVASAILPPYVSFIMAGLNSLTILVISTTTTATANPFAIGDFFVIALVSWLATHTMERSQNDLRILNRELDQRVEQRTGELRAILDSTADGIVVFNTDGRATVTNPAAADLLDRPINEIVDVSIETLMGDEGKHTLDTLFKNGKRKSNAKLERGGKTLLVTAAPVHLKSGEEIGTVAVFHDFTREAEVDRMKSSFLSIASHDLRSPLGSILGLTELVREGVYTTPEEQRDVIDRVYSHTQYMLSLANSLLGRAQIEAGILQLRPSLFSPVELVASVVSAMEMRAQEKDVELVAHVADDIPDMIIGDREKINQVLFNLVGNAIKFTEEGSVQIRAYVQDDEHWALAVSDTGSGVSEDEQSIIFEPFRRAEGTSAAGVGLGLSIVKQLVELMGGEIRLESLIGKGSTFTVVLPIASETQQRIEMQTN